MKKLFAYLMLSMFICGGLIIPTNANETSMSGGVIPETDEEYNTPERVEQRKQKKEQLAEFQSLSEVSLYSALQADINSNIGLILPFELSYLYSGMAGWHMVAAKGYSSNSVIYLDPWDYDESIFGEHEVSLSAMQKAIAGAENKIVW